MEYVKKQSLAEEEFRKKHGKGKGKETGDEGEDDEELKKAMEDTRDVKEAVLERYLSNSIGYRRWSAEGMGSRPEPLSLTLRVRFCLYHALPS